MTTANLLRSAVLLAGIAMAGATPAFAKHAGVDCDVNPANVDCIMPTQPDVAQAAGGAMVNPAANANASAFWLPQGGDGVKPGHGG